MEGQEDERKRDEDIRREVGRGVCGGIVRFMVSCFRSLETLVLGELGGFGSTSLTASAGIISQRDRDRKISVLQGFSEVQMLQNTGSSADHMIRPQKSAVAQKLLLVIRNDQNRWTHEGEQTEGQQGKDKRSSWSDRAAQGFLTR